TMRETYWRRTVRAGACVLLAGMLSAESGAIKAKSVTQVAASAPAYWPDAGTVKGNLYTNNFFGFSVELPKGWKILDKEVLHTLQGPAVQKTVEQGGDRQRAEIAAQTQLAGAMDDVRKPGPERRMVMIFATPIDPEAGLRPPDEETLRRLAARS